MNRNGLKGGLIFLYSENRDSDRALHVDVLLTGITNHFWGNLIIKYLSIYIYIDIILQLKCNLLEIRICLFFFPTKIALWIVRYAILAENEPLNLTISSKFIIKYHY